MTPISIDIDTLALQWLFATVGGLWSAKG